MSSNQNQNEKQTQTRRLIKKKVVLKIVTKSEMEKENERLKAKIARLEEDRDEAERILNEKGYWWNSKDETYYSEDFNGNPREDFNANLQEEIDEALIVGLNPAEREADDEEVLRARSNYGTNAL
tara:strand:+ start:300 stop:674 length:375 start_codon:yes stop_codon:yes gene_type:complete